VQPLPRHTKLAAEQVTASLCGRGRRKGNGESARKSTGRVVLGRGSRFIDGSELISVGRRAVWILITLMHCFPGTGAKAG
jgi:hypothetical protein